MSFQTMKDAAVRDLACEPEFIYLDLLRAGATSQQAHRLLDEQSDETRKLVEMRREKEFVWSNGQGLGDEARK
jgi:hypothetical protein